MNNIFKKMFGKKENNKNNEELNKNNSNITDKSTINVEDTQEEAKIQETQENKIDSQQILEEENKKLKESLMRTLAELDNTRKRSIEENEKTAKYSIGKFAEDLIPVMEDFYLAFDNVKENDLSNEKSVKNFFDGIKLTQNELKKVFEKNGLLRLFPINEEFNPDLHNAITQIESDEEEGKIIQVMQAGYKIKDRLLRPALVGVAKLKA